MIWICGGMASLPCRDGESCLYSRQEAVFREIVVTMIIPLIVQNPHMHNNFSPMPPFASKVRHVPQNSEG
jgi:hypothetical protein